MLFTERVPKKWHFWNRKYRYEVNDLFGTIIYFSKKKLLPHQLDRLTMVVMHCASGKGKAGPIDYIFNKRPLWDEDEQTAADNSGS